MVVTTDILKEKYQNYSNVNEKIQLEEKKGNLIRLKRGLYETDLHVDSYKLSQFIYSPSYISFDYALYLYSLIPEGMVNITCATFNKRKTKYYRNKFALFIYSDVPQNVYPYGVNIVQDGDYTYQIATPEKALCDKLYSLPPIRSIKDLKNLLFIDLRIDEDEFNKLNREDLLFLCPLYKATNLKLLEKLIQGEKNEYII